jgi:hypothetical protein
MKSLVWWKIGFNVSFASVDKKPCKRMKERKIYDFMIPWRSIEIKMAI